MTAKLLSDVAETLFSRNRETPIRQPEQSAKSLGDFCPSKNRSAWRIVARHATYIAHNPTPHTIIAAPA